MNTKVFYALVWTICGAVFQLVLFFSGFQTEKLATGKYLQWLSLIIAAVVLWLGIKAMRDEAPGRSLTYGKRVGAGVLISLFAGLMSAVYTWFHFRFINVNFADYSMTAVREEWAKAGMSASQMDQFEKFTRTMMSPEVQALLTPVMMVLVGTILSLILAAFLEAKPAAVEAAPPTS